MTRLYVRDDLYGEGPMFQLDTDDGFHAVGHLDRDALHMRQGRVVDAVLMVIEGMIQSVECRRRGEPMIACGMRPRAKGGEWLPVEMINTESRTAKLQGDDVVYAWADLEYES